MAQLYVINGIDLLHPRYQDLSNIQSGKDNPMGWRMVEFPLYQGVAAMLALGMPSVSVDVWLRLISILSAAGGSAAHADYEKREYAACVYSYRVHICDSSVWDVLRAGYFA